MKSILEIVMWRLQKALWKVFWVTYESLSFALDSVPVISISDADPSWCLLCFFFFFFFFFFFLFWCFECDSSDTAASFGLVFTSAGSGLNRIDVVLKFYRYMCLDVKFTAFILISFCIVLHYFHSFLAI